MDAKDKRKTFCFAAFRKRRSGIGADRGSGLMRPFLSLTTPPWMFVPPIAEVFPTLWIVIHFPWMLVPPSDLLPSPTDVTHWWMATAAAKCLAFLGQISS